MTIRVLEDLSPLEKLALIEISYSRISSYDMCSAKYFYSYIIKEQPIFSPPAVLGNMVHDVLEHTVGEDELDLGEMLRNFAHFKTERDPEGQVGTELIGAAENMLMEFVDRHEPEDFDVLGREVAFEIVINSALVRGFIDRVDRIDDGILICDYKTGKYEESAKSIPNNLQLGIYVLACSHLYPEIDTFQAELYYLRSGRRKGHTFTRADLPALETSVAAKINDIIEDRFFHFTYNERICGFCEHATSGICSTGVKRRQKNLRRKH